MTIQNKPILLSTPVQQLYQALAACIQLQGEMVRSKPIAIATLKTILNVLPRRNEKIISGDSQASPASKMAGPSGHISVKDIAALIKELEEWTLEEMSHDPLSPKNL